MSNNIKNILLKDYIYYLLVSFILIFSLLYTNLYKLKSIYTGDETNFIGTVISTNIDGNKLSITINSKEKLTGSYYIKNKNEKTYFENNIKFGDTVNIKGTLYKPTNNSVPHLFNYKKYLYNNKIYWTISIENIKKIKNSKNVFINIRQKIFDRINRIDNTNNYLNAFVLGNSKMIDNGVKSSYQTNGISHLFAVSGMHVTLLSGVIIFLLKKLNFNDNITYLITILFLIFYMFLTNYTPSIMRASIMFILLTINKIYKLKIKTINILLLTLFITLSINPYLIYNLGFQFSFTISFFLILFNDLISKYKNYFSKLFIISFISFLASLPINIYNFFQINVFGILLNIIFVPLVSFVVFPLSLIVFVFPYLNPMLNMIITYMEKLSLFLSNIKVFNIILAKPNIMLLLLYYGIIFLILKTYKKRYIIIFVCILFIHSNIPRLDINQYVLSIDVGQGDSTLIVLPNNKGNILIDTGGKITYQKEKWKKTLTNNLISDNTLIPLFKSNGIKRINYLIITHGDYDHMGEAINLVENFKVEKVIFNCGEFNELEQELIKVLDKKKILYYSCIKELNIDNNKLYFLNNKDYGNENDNSSVIYTKLNNYKFLFMGDAGVEVEEDLIEKYYLNDIDVLKVGHHGSKTSSAKTFIDEIKPKYSIISVGKNNKYGHPNKDVLNNLEKSKIYKTDQDGSIMFKFKNNKLEVEICAP